ncbi:MAG: hypothetical protein AB2556_22325 [Candidatus Thiodiazotropha sp.]
MTNRGELDFFVRDTRLSGTLVGAPIKCELGSQPQFTRLRASMLAYAHINILSMLRRFEPEEAVRVATDSIYIRKTALHKLKGVGSYVALRICDCGEYMCGACMLGEPFLSPVAPAKRRDKGEKLYMSKKHGAYLAGPAFVATKRDLPPSTAPRHEDPLSRHALSYLNGGGGSGKTTRAIELFRQKEPLFTATHRRQDHASD